MSLYWGLFAGWVSWVGSRGGGGTVRLVLHSVTTFSPCFSAISILQNPYKISTISYLQRSIMFLIEPPIFMNGHIMKIQLIKDVIGRLDGSSQDRSIDNIIVHVARFEKFGTLLDFFDSER